MGDRVEAPPSPVVERGTYDLAVVGAGPAGATCALIAAESGLRVLLADPRVDGREKPCGEGVMPAGVAVLQRLGLGARLERVRRFDGLRWCLAGQASLELDLPAPGMAVRRAVLQGWLDELVERTSRITVVRGRAATDRSRAGFRVRVGSGAYEARTLAACDGLGGSAAAWLRGADRGRGEPRLGLRAHYASTRPLDRVEVHLGRDAEIYLTPLDDGVVNVAVLRRAPVVEPADRRRSSRRSRGTQDLLEAAFDELPAARRTLGRLIGAPAARSLPSRRPRRVASDGAFLCGDAGGGVDPIVGCGVTVALRSGVAAAESAAALLAGATPGEPEHRYARAYRNEVRFRRGLAWFLGCLGRHPRLARSALASARALPSVSSSWVARVALGAQRGRFDGFLRGA